MSWLSNNSILHQYTTHNSMYKTIHNRGKLQLLFSKYYSNTPVSKLAALNCMLTVDITCTHTTQPACMNYSQISDTISLFRKQGGSCLLCLNTSYTNVYVGISNPPLPRYIVHKPKLSVCTWKFQPAKLYNSNGIDSWPLTVQWATEAAQYGSAGVNAH